MSALDVERVLLDHEEYEWWPMTREFICTCEASLGRSYPDKEHRAHVAAKVREHLADWIKNAAWTETARDDLLAAITYVLPPEVSDS